MMKHWLLFLLLASSATSLKAEPSFKDAAFLGDHHQVEATLWADNLWHLENDTLFSAGPKMNLNNVLQLEERLKAHIIDQDEAIRATTNAFLRYAAAIADPKTPIATLLYIGPTGVGKTELAKVLARELYGSDRYLLRFNMQEFASDQDGVHRLIGLPQGYSESEKGGQLTNALAEYPNSIILLDEIDKAAPTVRKLFMQLFDEGLITSARGQVLSARDVVFIMTSNYAADEILQFKKQGYTTDQILVLVEPALMKALSPELYNRLDVSIFYGLSSKSMELLTVKMLQELATRVYNAKRIKLEFDATLINYLKEMGYSAKLGARPLKRLIEKDLTTEIAKAILQGRIAPYQTIKVSFKDDAVVLTKQ